MTRNKFLLVFLLLAACNRSANTESEGQENTAQHEETDAEEGGHGEEGEHGDDHGDGPEGGLIRLTPEAVTTVGIKAQPAKIVPFAQGIIASGEVIPNPDRMAIVGPGAGGRIAKVMVTLGDQVSAGATLLALESPEISHALGELLEARSNLRAADAAASRERTLREKQIASERSVLEAEAQRAAAQAAYDTAVAGVRILGLSEERALALAKQRTFRIPIRAPIGGVIIERNAIAGQTVETNDTLFVVADLSEVMVDLQLPESVAFRVKPGAPAELTPVADPSQRILGKVAYVSPVLTEGSRTVHVRVAINNKELQLKPRMFVTGRVQTTEEAPTLTIPIEAVQQMEGNSIVFVQKEVGEYEARSVVLGNRDGEQVAVDDGLREGEQVVVKGAFALKGEAAKESIGGHDH